jgi:hypothetical protein
MGLDGPTADGRVFARLAVDENLRAGGPRGYGYRLYPIDPTAARVGLPLTDAKGGELNFAGWNFGLSPSGRFARIAGTGSTWEDVRLADLAAGVEVPDAGVPPWARWIPGDRRYWSATLDHRSRMFLAAGTESPQPLREWTAAAVHVDAAPGGQAFFVSVLPEIPNVTSDGTHFVPDLRQFAGEVPAGAIPEELVYLTTENRFIRPGPPFSDHPNDLRYTLWAGSKTLARIAPGVVFFEDLDAPGRRRFVIGGASDLE